MFFPAGEEDADPFERQGADNGIVFLAFGLVELVVGFGPDRPAHGMLSEFMKRLEGELRALPAAVNPLSLTAAFGDWSDPGKLLNLGGR